MTPKGYTESAPHPCASWFLQGGFWIAGWSTISIAFIARFAVSASLFRSFRNKSWYYAHCYAKSSPAVAPSSPRVFFAVGRCRRFLMGIPRAVPRTSALPLRPPLAKISPLCRVYIPTVPAWNRRRLFSNNLRCPIFHPIPETGFSGLCFNPARTGSPGLYLQPWHRKVYRSVQPASSPASSHPCSLPPPFSFLFPRRAHEPQASLCALTITATKPRRAWPPAPPRRPLLYVDQFPGPRRPRKSTHNLRPQRFLPTLNSFIPR